MKNNLKHLAIAVAGMLVLTGCSQGDTLPAPEKPNGEISFSTEKPELEGPTRTVFENGSIFWNTTGEAIRMAYTLDGEFTNKKFYQSNSSSVSADRKTATFTVSGNFSDETQGMYQFYTLYPAAAVSSADINYAPSISVKVSDTQAPPAGSFDPAADIMLGRSVSTYPSIPTEAVALRHTRMVAHGCVTLSNLPFEAGETIRSIAFTAPGGTPVAGQTFMDLTQQTITDTQSATNTLTLHYGDAAPGTGGDFDAWFCSIPFTVTEGQPFSVEVRTSRGTYTRTITARSEGIEFRKNHFNKLNVGMASATFLPDEDLGLSGDYVVLAPVGSSYSALSATASTTRLLAVPFAYDGTSPTVVTDDPSLVWTFAKSGGGYTLSCDGKYLYYGGDSSGNVASTSALPCNFTITRTADDRYMIAYEAFPSRILARNATAANNYFAFYSGTQINELCLVPATYAALPVISVAETELPIAHDDTSVQAIGVTLKNAEAEDVAVACYAGTEGTEACTWLQAAYNGATGNVEITAQPNPDAVRTARVVLTATTSLGTASATVEVTQGAAGMAADWEEVTDFQTVGTGRYIYIAINNGTNYYMKNVTATNQKVVPGTTDMLPTAIGFTATADMVLTFTGTQAAGFTIGNGTDFLGATTTANGVSMLPANSTTKWVVNANATCGFTFKQTTPNADRYLGYYAAGTTEANRNYRSYTNESGNITDSSYKLYRYIGQ